MRTNLIEVFGMLFVLTFIAIGGIANQWNECGPAYFSIEDAAEGSTTEIKKMLNLDLRQTTVLRKINYRFFDDVTQICEKHNNASRKQIDALTIQRHDQIMNILDPQQRLVWKNAQQEVVMTTSNFLQSRF
jgi:hypothetical protein